MDGVEIRMAVAGDWGPLRDVEVRAGALFRELGMDEVADDGPPSAEELAAAAAVLVAVDTDGTAVGYARVELVDGHAHLEQLSVVPEQGGRGVGTALLEAVASWAVARGDAEVTLTTFRDVPFNAPLYARRSFVAVPEADWTEEMHALVRLEAAHGLEPSTRTVMRLRLDQ